MLQRSKTNKVERKFLFNFLLLFSSSLNIVIAINTYVENDVMHYIGEQVRPSPTIYNVFIFFAQA